MESLVKKFLGAGPYPFPLDKITEVLNIYTSDTIFISSNKNEMNLFEGTHSHSSYEFVIPLTRSIPSKVEKKCIVIEKNKLFPINSGQNHGPNVQITGARLMALQIDKELFSEISLLALGKEEEVIFENESVLLSVQMRNLIECFMEEYVGRQAGYEFILQSLSTQIAVNLLRQVKNNIQFTNRRTFFKKENITRAIDFLRSLYNSNYSLEEVARVANLSTYHFIRVFKAQTGKTPYEFLIDVKMEKAREMLKFKKLSITEVSFACGFNNPGHFSTVFKRKVGISPSDYRKMHV